MDYEQKYKEALERAEKIINYYKEHNRGDESAIEDLEEVFPELQESEDERIRKELIEYFSEQCDMSDWNGVYGYQVVAWLEKQKSVRETVERCKNSWYNEGKIAGMAEGLTNDEKYQQGWHDALEKQGEQKSSWSEDDERIITALMEGFRYHQLFNPRFGEVPNAEIISWIKSLKERLS